METPREFDCPQCGRTLAVPGATPGAPVRCPACQHVFAVPAPTASSPSGDRWLLWTPDELTYGPVERSELEKWVGEGRVTADCRLRQESHADWHAADSIFPALRETAPVQATSSKPLGGITHGPAATSGNVVPASQPLPTVAAVVVPTPPPPGATQFLRPHRGELILVLGLIGLVVQCPIFSVMAWVMGTADLDEMQRGLMDPAGAGTTRAGRFLGLILSLFWIIMAVVVVGGGLFTLAVRGTVF